MKHKLAVIGYGGMGGWHVRNVKQKLSDLWEIAGVWDIRECRREAAQKAGIHVYASLEDLLADPQVEVVTIATPNNFHKPLSLAALEAGKNVICEKPVMMNADELSEVVSLSKECGKFFTAHQNRRWDKDFRIVKKVLEDGSLGKPFCIESRVMGGRRVLHEWRGYKENGGGMVLDWGVHLIDQMLLLTDSPVVSVYAVEQRLYTDQVDDNFSLRLVFENGLTAVIEVLTCCFVPMPRWQVYGDHGTLRIEDWNCTGKLLQVRDDIEPEWSESIVYTEGGPTRTMAPLPVDATRELPLPEIETDWSHYYRNIAAILEGKEEPLIRYKQMRRDMQIVDLTFESIRTGKSISCRV